MLVALATLAALPTTQAARTEPRPIEAIPAEATRPAAEKASKLSRAGKAARESAYDKLSLNKLSYRETGPKEAGSRPKA